MSDDPTDPGSRSGLPGKRPLVIGLAGGVASGKSAVAAEFERLGFVVTRSDQRAHAMLERADVINTLVEWYGPDVLDSSGGVSRRALADVIFGDAAERRRVEGLIHPMLHAERRALIERAGLDGVVGVVVDAPLLFEAGVDAECDVVVFVDCPREMRLRRAVESRGWDEAEFDRRENAQLGLDAKRSRADYVVVNDAGREELAGRVQTLLSEILASRAARA